jgi:histidinol-phosphate/aromatic aminotransferase/cobyric acid decarboxylase-like protein
VVLFQPLYDSYLPLILHAGCIPRIVDLHPPRWHIDYRELRAAFSPATKLVVVSPPPNRPPTIPPCQHVCAVSLWTMHPPTKLPTSQRLILLFNDMCWPPVAQVNTPHNPTGKVFTRQELQWIAELCQEVLVGGRADPPLPQI